MSDNQHQHKEDNTTDSVQTQFRFSGKLNRTLLAISVAVWTGIVLYYFTPIFEAIAAAISIVVGIFLWLFPRTSRLYRHARFHHPIATSSLSILLTLGLLFIIELISTAQSAPTAQPEPSTNSNSLSISTIPHRVFNWGESGFREVGGNVDMSVSSENPDLHEFKLEYSIPVEASKEFNAGIVFAINTGDEKGYDLSEYDRIKIVLRLSRDAECTWGITDIEKNRNFFPFVADGEYPDDVEVISTGGVWTVIIPLDQYFDNVKFENVIDMGCGINTKQTAGDHYIGIQEITFLK
jgi:uncharacterized membrane protein